MGGNVDKVKALIIAAVVCIIAGLTAVTCYYQGEAARLQEEVTVTKGALKTASNTIQQMKERNAELSKLDKRYHDECPTPPRPPAALMEPPASLMPLLDNLIYPSENN